MSVGYSEFAQVCEQVKQWPSELRQDLVEEISRSLVAESATSGEDWDDAQNERRCELIDKDIQEKLSPQERRELEALTHQLRLHRRSFAPIPLEGAIRLHSQLLEKKRQHKLSGEMP